MQQPMDSLIGPMKALRADPATDELVYDTHYFISNEEEHHTWRESVSDLGGMMVGVGAEQNYVIAGWARPELLVLADFDNYIPLIHKVYGVAFEMAATPDEFIALWRDEKGRQRLSDGIARTYEGSKELRLLIGALTESTYHNRFLTPGGGFQRLQAKYRDLGIPCFLTDQEHYEFIASLWRRGRVLPVQGDLTGRYTFVDIANLSKALDLPVRVLYMSNCESYFNRSDGRFRDNIMGLPFDAKSQVLRTEKRPPPRPGAAQPICAAPLQLGTDFASELEREKAAVGELKVSFWDTKEILDWAEGTIILLEKEPIEYRRSEIAHRRLREAKRNVQFDMHDTVEFMVEQMVVEVNHGDLYSDSQELAWPR